LRTKQQIEVNVNENVAAKVRVTSIKKPSKTYNGLTCSYWQKGRSKVN